MRVRQEIVDMCVGIMYVHVYMCVCARVSDEQMTLSASFLGDKSRKYGQNVFKMVHKIFTVRRKLYYMGKKISTVREP